MVGVVTPRAAAVAETTEQTRAVVSWAGQGEPIMLTLYGPSGDVAVPLLPKRALLLAQEMPIQRIKSVSWGGLTVY